MRNRGFQKREPQVPTRGGVHSNMERQRWGERGEAGGQASRPRRASSHTVRTFVIILT